MLRGFSVFELCNVRTNVNYTFGIGSVMIWKLSFKKYWKGKIFHDYEDKWLNCDIIKKNIVKHVLFYFLFCNGTCITDIPRTDIKLCFSKKNDILS